MKKKVVLICSMIAVAIMIPIVLVCFAFGLAPQYDLSFYGGMTIKYDRLYNTDDRKVVIIGGSSVAFGVRSDILQDEIGMPVVNFGLYANLGTKYMLDVAENAINKDDIVIIAPEQNAQSLSMYFNGEAVWYSVDGHYEILGEVDKENYSALFGSFLKFASGKFGFWQKGEKPKPDGVYNVDSFDDYGDITFERPYNIMKDGYDAGTPIYFDKDIISSDFIDYLNAYSQRLRNAGATVYYSFCPMNSAALVGETTEDTIFDYYDHLRENLTVDILGNPVKRILDKEWFYDSNFHLNSDGAIYYTAQLAQDLKSVLSDYSSVKVDIPQKPQKPDDGGTSGIISEELKKAGEIFELSGVDIKIEDGEILYVGEWRVDGLTEYGASLEKLVLPDTLVGLHVATLADGCFARSQAKEIVFGKNISSVNKAAFEDCGNLTRIYITSTDPTVLRPSPDILDGLDNCAFYVPEQAYVNYTLDYFWGYFGGSKLHPY